MRIQIFNGWWIVLGAAAAILCCATIFFREAIRRIESEMELSEADVDLFRQGALPLPKANSSSEGLVLDAMLGRLPFAHADYAIITEDTFEAGVSAIKRAPEIKEVHVMFSTIDEAKVEELSELRHLRTLKFAGCSISDDLHSVMQQNLPSCNVERLKNVQSVPPELRYYERFIDQPLELPR